MGVSAIIEDGMVANAAASSSAKTSGKGETALGKDDFLQLLVAQMKYQDTLEPTSNTEYIAQYATFSEVEQMQNMSQSMDLSRASGLVGQMVQITTTNDSGVESTFMGKVDYVKYENGKALVAIDEELYSLDDVTHVCDQQYLEAYEMASGLVGNVAKLPKVDEITVADKDAVTKVLETYDAMNDYQKTFVADQVKRQIELYREKLAQVVKNAEESSDK